MSQPAMQSEADGVEVVATAAEAGSMERAPLLVLDRLTAYLDAQGLDAQVLGTGPLSWRRIGDGQSNLTYLMQRGEARFVLRRGPRPPHPPSTHDMVREARIQQLLAPAGVPVPRILAVCDDADVLGVPFYLMEALDGVVVTTAMPPGMDAPADRAGVVEAMVDTLAGLHAIDPEAAGLGGLGRPEGYLERQVRRFGSLWEVNSRRDVPAVAELGGWLAEHLPRSQRHAMVHGDYRLGNLMLEPAAPPRVQAVLDWEMATLGDPLADLGYLTATYTRPGAELTPLDMSTVTAGPGFPSVDDIAERYALASGLDLSALGWYQTLAMWKAAIFCEALYTRWLAGERPGDTFAPALEDGVPLLLERARALSASA